MKNDDLKNLLLSSIDEIAVRTESVLNAAGNTLPKEQRNHIEHILRSAQQWHEFIDQIMLEESVQMNHLSFEIRTPLIAIRGFCDLLLKYPQIYGKSLSVGQSERIQEIAELERQLSKLVETEIFHTTPRE